LSYFIKRIKLNVLSSAVVIFVIFCSVSCSTVSPWSAGQFKALAYRLRCIFSSCISYVTNGADPLPGLTLLAMSCQVIQFHCYTLVKSNEWWLDRLSTCSVYRHLDINDLTISAACSS